MSDRSFYGPIDGFHNLNIACQIIVAGFGMCMFLVGSSQERRDYRDVDVRAMLDDEVFNALFPGDRGPGAARIDARLLALNLSISAYLSRQSGLPVDFQFQRQSDANRLYGDRPRNPLGIERWT